MIRRNRFEVLHSFTSPYHEQDYDEADFLPYGSRRFIYRGNIIKLEADTSDGEMIYNLYQLGENAKPTLGFYSFELMLRTIDDFTDESDRVAFYERRAIELAFNRRVGSTMHKIIDLCELDFCGYDAEEVKSFIADGLFVWSKGKTRGLRATRLARKLFKDQVDSKPVKREPAKASTSKGHRAIRQNPHLLRYEWRRDIDLFTTACEGAA